MFIKILLIIQIICGILGIISGIKCVKDCPPTIMYCFFGALLIFIGVIQLF
jgi:uncharacterized membrane protein YfcA